MKKLNLLLTFLLIATAYGQSTHTFSHKLSYSFIAEDIVDNDVFFVEHYVPEKFTETSKNSVLLVPIFNLEGSSGYIYLDNGKAVEIQSKDLNNNFEISSKLNSYSFQSSPIDTLFSKVELVKLHSESKSILNKTCNYYQINTTNNGMPKSDFKICVDESSNIDNLSFIFPNQEGKHIKGLILSLSPMETELKEGIQLVNIENVNSTIQFDFQKEWTDYLAKKDKQQKELDELYGQDIDSAVYADDYAYISEYANQPSICQYDGFFDLDFETDHALDIASNYLSSICSVSYYMKPGEEDKYKSYVLRDAKTATKNFRKEGLMSKKDANMFFEFIKKGFENLKAAEPIVYDYANAVVEAAAEAVVDAADFDDYYYDYSYVVPYESVYGTMKPEDSNFAIDNLEAQSEVWNSMPIYCKKLDSILPNFSSAELKNHAKNYAGQICDMYLGEFMPESVWYKGTLDAIRAEQKYFSTIRGTLNNNDTKLLDEFLNSLD